MTLLILSFLAGILTVLAPCVLPILPVIIGGSIGDNNKYRPYWIIFGLVVSITLFTILLKASTILLNIDPVVWKIISGGILILFGLTYLFPVTWDRISVAVGLSKNSDELLHNASQKSGISGALLMGGALGPVFASCSPTYSLIIATILPVNFVQGLIYIIIYSLGLAVVLLAIALLGRNLVKRLNILANPNGWFKKILAVIFIIIGISIITGFDKQVETNILNAGYFDVTRVDQQLLDKHLTSQSTENMSTTSSTKNTNPLTPELNENGSQLAPEITGISDWINSNGETIQSLKGKVVLVDFWTYSCINCQRTLPFVTKWYDTYKDQGFVVLGIHAPEFSFEQKKDNVQKAVNENHINYPVGLDNNLATWGAYSNHYWPAEYLIDKTGHIRRTHFGEGSYDETEKAIRYLLQEQGHAMTQPLVATGIKYTTPEPQHCENGKCTPLSPETYLGSARGERFANVDELQSLDKPQKFSLKSDISSDNWSLDGSWSIQSENIISDEDGTTLRYKFNAQHVYLVMGGGDKTSVKVTVNGQLQSLGENVDKEGNVAVNDYKVYKLVNADQFLTDATLELKIDKGVSLNAFTFG